MRGAFIGIVLACSSSLCIVRWVVGSRLRFLTFIGTCAVKRNGAVGCAVNSKTVGRLTCKNKCP